MSQLQFIAPAERSIGLPSLDDGVSLVSPFCESNIALDSHETVEPIRLRQYYFVCIHDGCLSGPRRPLFPQVTWLRKSLPGSHLKWASFTDLRWALRNVAVARFVGDH